MCAIFPHRQMELLRAYDPRFNIPGRAPCEALQHEASAMQDGLLAHPRLADFGAEVSWTLDNWRGRSLGQTCV